MFKKAFIIGFGFFVGKYTAGILDYIVGKIYEKYDVDSKILKCINHEECKLEKSKNKIDIGFRLN